MRRHRAYRFLFHLLIAVPLAAQEPTGEDLHAWVRGIEGRDPQGRRQFVVQEIKRLGLSCTTMPFIRVWKEKTVSGENIVVPLGSGKRTLVVGAHVDAEPGSPGANDNGSGVAVLLGLLRTLKDRPWNHRVLFCFFDQEEAGLVGSREFVGAYGDSSNHVAMLNLDVEGMGDAVYVGPVGGGDDDVVMPLARKAAEQTGLAMYESQHYPPSDHLSFARRKLENLSISVVPESDVPLLIEMVAKGWKSDPDRMPEVLKTMHTPGDKSDLVSPKSLLTSFTFTKTLLLLLDGISGKN